MWANGKEEEKYLLLNRSSYELLAVKKPKQYETPCIRCQGMNSILELMFGRWPLSKMAKNIHFYFDFTVEQGHD